MPKISELWMEDIESNERPCYKCGREVFMFGDGIKDHVMNFKECRAMIIWLHPSCQKSLENFLANV